MSRSQVPESMFEFLDETHRTIQSRLRALRGLVDAMQTVSLSAAQRLELGHLCRYFAEEGRQHHLDEELHVFPALLESHNDKWVHVTRQLMQDHGWIEENWLEFGPQLDAVASGSSGYDPQVLGQMMDVLESLYSEHMALEEMVAYPSARQIARTWDEERMTREMTQRRQLRSSRTAATSA